MGILLIMNSFFDTQVGYTLYSNTSDTIDNIVTYIHTYKDSNEANPVMQIYFNMYSMSLVLNGIVVFNFHIKEYIDKQNDYCKLLPDLMTEITSTINKELILLNEIKEICINKALEPIIKIIPEVEIIDAAKNVMYIVNDFEVESRQPEDDGYSYVHLQCDVINHAVATTSLSLNITNKVADNLKIGSKIYYINNELLLPYDSLIN